MQWSTVVIGPPDNLCWTGVRSVLATIKDVEVVAVASSLVRGGELIQAQTPDVVVIGVGARADDRPDVEAHLAALDTILRTHPCPEPMPVVALDLLDREPHLLPAYRSIEVVAFLTVAALPTDALRDALRAAFHPDLCVASKAIVATIPRTAWPAPATIPEVAVTEHERDCLRALDNGLKIEGWARQCGINRRSAERTIAHLREKLDAPTLFVLGSRARSLGLLDD